MHFSPHTFKVRQGWGEGFVSRQKGRTDGRPHKSKSTLTLYLDDFERKEREIKIWGGFHSNFSPLESFQLTPLELSFSTDAVVSLSFIFLSIL